MFELACPWVFLLLPLPWLVGLFLPPVTTASPSALKVPFFQALLLASTRDKSRRLHQKKWLHAVFIWILVLAALSGPRWVGEIQPTSQEGYNMMMALDISGSMGLDDMTLHGQPATRLTIVKRAAKQFVAQRVGDKMGLILFGSKAYLQTPLTYDRQNVLTRLDDATVGLAGQSTSIGDALGLAIKRLQHVPAKGRMIILLTDGVNNSGVLSPLKAAELAKNEKIKVYTIGLGSDVAANTFGGLFMQMNAMADLDEPTLKKIAKVTDGRYFRATDLASLQAIYDHINQMERIDQEQAVIRPMKEYYPWPLALALGFVFIGFLVHLKPLWGRK